MAPSHNPTGYFPMFGSNVVHKGTGALGPNFDAFDRDIAPTLEPARYHREFCEADLLMRQAQGKSKDIDIDLNTVRLQDSGSTSPEAMVPEMERRREIIEDGNKLQKACGTRLKALDHYSSKVDRKSTEKRRAIAAKIQSIFPAVQADLIRIETKISDELTRLRIQNSDLLLDRGAARMVATINKQLEDLKSHFANIGRSEAATEIAKLKDAINNARSGDSATQDLLIAQAGFDGEKRGWEAEKAVLKEDVSKWERLHRGVCEDLVKALGQKAAVSSQHTQADNLRSRLDSEISTANSLRTDLVNEKAKADNLQNQLHLEKVENLRLQQLVKDYEQRERRDHAQMMPPPPTPRVSSTATPRTPITEPPRTPTANSAARRRGSAQSSDTGSVNRQPGEGYTFLVNGELANGTRVSANNVNSEVVDEMERQIQRWRNEDTSWRGHSAVSHKRCSSTRIKRKAKNKNPPASENPNVACKDCVQGRVLCVLVGDDGPVVVPLPESCRDMSVTPQDKAFYLKPWPRVSQTPGDLIDPDL